MIGKDICQPTYLSPSTPVFIQIRSLVGQLISKKITKVLKNELLAVHSPLSSAGQLRRMGG